MRRSACAAVCCAAAAAAQTPVTTNCWEIRPFTGIEWAQEVGSSTTVTRQLSGSGTKLSIWCLGGAITSSGGSPGWWMKVEAAPTNGSPASTFDATKSYQNGGTAGTYTETTYSAGSASVWTLQFHNTNNFLAESIDLFLQATVFSDVAPPPPPSPTPPPTPAPPGPVPPPPPPAPKCVLQPCADSEDDGDDGKHPGQTCCVPNADPPQYCPVPGRKNTMFACCDCGAVLCECPEAVDSVNATIATFKAKVQKNGTRK